MAGKRPVKHVRTYRDGHKTIVNPDVVRRPKSVLPKKPVKRSVDKLNLNLTWKDVLQVDDGTNYPVTNKLSTVGEGKLFSHYGKGVKIADARSVANLVRSHADMDREFFMVLGLSTANTVVFKEIVSVGILNSALIHAREVFKKAILYSCKSVILVHNHPSGDVTPSSDDLDVTKKMIRAGEYLDIAVLDHVIVGPGDRYYSLKSYNSELFRF
jgi:proteasome lid subunit RPN8/RPN11